MKKLILVICAGLITSSCGGGGGDGGYGSFAGRWETDFTALQNDCNYDLGIEGQISPYLISQEEDRVTVQNIVTSATFDGAADSSNSSFIVGGSAPIACRPGVGRHDSYISLVRDSDDSGYMEVGTSYTCGDTSAICQVRLGGPSVRR